MNVRSFLYIVLVCTVTRDLWSRRGLVLYLLSSIFFTLFSKVLLWQGGIWYWLFLELFEKVILCYFKNVRCLHAWGMVLQIPYYWKCALFLTFYDSWIGLAKLISLLFLSIRNFLMCWLSFTSNEYFVIIGRIKHRKSQCGKVQILLCKHPIKMSQNICFA